MGDDCVNVDVGVVATAADDRAFRAMIVDCCSVYARERASEPASARRLFARPLASQQRAIAANDGGSDGRDDADGGGSGDDDDDDQSLDCLPAVAAVVGR